jgi:DNA-binding IclR family transcriptional regulator
MRPTEREKFLSRPFYRTMSAHGITREDAVSRLEAEKAEGVAFDLEELDQGVCAVSAPVFERDGTVKAALTIVAPAERFNESGKDKYAKALKNTATALGRAISGQSITD